MQFFKDLFREYGLQPFILGAVFVALIAALIYSIFSY